MSIKFGFHATPNISCRCNVAPQLQ